MKQRREESRAKQTEKINKGLRKPETFAVNDTVYLRDQEGKWNVPAKVINQRWHQGFTTPSYLLRNLKTGTLTMRNERDIRKFEGDNNLTTPPTRNPTDDPHDAEESVNNITVGIMKQRTEQRADKTEKLLLGRAEESNIEDKSGPTTQEASVTDSSWIPVNLVNPRSLCWSKTIKIIRFEEPHAQSSYSLHEHFASRPRIQRIRKDEPVVRDKEKISDEDSQEDQG